MTQAITDSLQWVAIYALQQRDSGLRTILTVIAVTILVTWFGGVLYFMAKAKGTK